MKDPQDPFDIETPTTPSETKKLKVAKGGVLSPIRIGNNVFIRSVTLYYTGHVVGLTKDEIVLSDAAWIPDTGRYADMLNNGAPKEIEPYPTGVITSVGRGAVVDVCDWKHPLPRSQQ